MPHQTFSDEELLKSAQLTANFWLLVTMAYLKQHNQSIAEWVRFGGGQMAVGYRACDKVGSLALVHHVALSVVALGGELIDLEGYEVAMDKFEVDEMEWEEYGDEPDYDYDYDCEPDCGDYVGWRDGWD